MTRRERLLRTLEGEEDIEAFLSLPLPKPEEDVEKALGDSGIVMLDTPDPLCLAAALFEMADYTVLAMTAELLSLRQVSVFAHSSQLPGDD